MVNCDKCGERLKRNAEFCLNCGDTITWPKVNSDNIDDLSQIIRSKGNEFLEDNLPEEYVDKIKEDLSYLHETTQDPNRSIIDENEKLSNAKENIITASNSIKQSSDDFIRANDSLNNAKDVILSASDSVKRSSSDFINNNVSYTTRDKIKSNFDNFSDSSRKFTSDASEVLNKIHTHRVAVKQQKKSEESYSQEQIQKEYLEKQRQKEINHQKTIVKIRETRTASIGIPVPKEGSSGTLENVVIGEMIGSGVGRTIGGLSGNSILDTINGGLIIGGIGALVGGVASAADDGIYWAESQIYIGKEELIFSGKYSISFDDIKLISTSKFKDNEIVVLTLKDRGIDFRTEDSEALKIVINEYIQEYISNKRKPSNVDELLKYGELYEKGVITKEELDEKKKELL